MTLEQKWGDEWDNIFGASEIGLPRGMVNRIGGQSPTLGKDEWLLLWQTN